MARTSRRKTSRSAASRRSLRRVSRNPKEKLEHEDSRWSTRAAADKQAKMFRTSYRDTFKARVQPMPSRSRPGETSYAVIISPTKSYEPIWRKLKGLPKKNPRRVSRNPPPAIYRGIGIGPGGHEVGLGAGPLSRVKDTTMAAWLGDPSMRSAYVLDPHGHSYLSLEPRDRSRLSANKLSELEVYQSVAAVRQHGHPTEMAGMLPPGVAAKFKKLPPGLYKYGWGPKKGESIVQFKNASMLGAMTSTRIGAAKVGEYHWVVDNFDPKFPVIIRGINDQGKTYFRIEEFAKPLLGEREVAVAARKKTTSKSRSASR